MDISGKTVWQQAAGDMDREYVDLCLRWNVILNGPGSAGAWPASEAALRAEGMTFKKGNDIRRFSGEMADGDLVVLRGGTQYVHAVGQVVGGYEWHDEFGDVDGWDLQHVRRVRWLWQSPESPQAFEPYAMKLGDTTQRLTSSAVLKWLASLDIPEDGWKRQLRPLPNAETRPELNMQEISEFLFDHGVGSTPISTLLDQIDELTRIGKWYRRAGRPSEQETVTYLVVPLLRALGWTPQRMAVEWNHVEVALFESLPRADSSLRVVVEAKKMDNSCLSAVSQAKAYAEPRAQCHRLVVADGLRYGVYVRCAAGPFERHAYLNLARLRRQYPVYDCRGAADALLAMAPEWKPGTLET